MTNALPLYHVELVKFHSSHYNYSYTHTLVYAHGRSVGLHVHMVRMLFFETCVDHNIEVHIRTLMSEHTVTYDRPTAENHVGVIFST